MNRSIHRLLQCPFRQQKRRSNVFVGEQASMMMSTDQTHYYDSHGDYLEDSTVLEDNSLPIYKHQHSIPLLPAPSIERSLELFLPSALPLARTKQESEALVRACEAFPTEASNLQERLLNRADALPRTSWLQQWWNTRGYLNVRTSNVLHVSYFLRMERPPIRMSPLERAAAVLHATHEYVTQLPMTDAGNLEHPTQRMCPTQFKYLFRSCRIPGEDVDSYRVYNHNNIPSHAVVAMNGQLFSVSLTDGAVPLSRTDLLRQLQECKEMSLTTTIPHVGWLTTQHRDDWFQSYRQLQAMLGTKAMDTLQSGLIFLAIDDEERNLSDSEQARNMWHGCSHNRWHDKSIQVVVTGNGEISGIIGEHSLADGMPTVGYCNHLKKQTSAAFNHISEDDEESISVQPTLIFDEHFQFLSINEQDQLHNMVDEAKARFSKRTQDYDMKVIRYDKLGKVAFKKAGLAPDAAVQMAMQLASSRYFGTHAVATYEAVQTRAFRHGRTETARSVSTASAQMCRELSWEILQQACGTHTAYTRRAVQGQGCDRHFLGLEYLLQSGEPRPQLFDDPVYVRSKTWLISTSTVPTLAPGFGPPDAGFGIGYDVRNDHLVFTISANRTETSLERYCALLVEALDDINVLLPQPVSKLTSKL